MEAIIGGESVLNPHEFPWVVGVRTESGKCGGTIITKNLVMTAAHCLFNTKKEFNKKISVLMGHSDISSTLIKKERVESILVHPQHGIKKYYNDVALLRLSKDLEFDNTVQPIALSNDDITGDLFYVAIKKYYFRYDTKALSFYEALVAQKFVQLACTAKQEFVQWVSNMPSLLY